MNVLLIALGGALFLEGAAYALFPKFMKQAMQEVLALDERALRIGGLISAIVGFLLIVILAHSS